jgi:hypothetical protein
MWAVDCFLKSNSTPGPDLATACHLEFYFKQGSVRGTAHPRRQSCGPKVSREVWLHCGIAFEAKMVKCISRFLF